MRIVSKQRLLAGFTTLRRVSALVLLGAALPLSGCGSSVSQLPGVGLPEGMPRAPENPPAIPPVGERRGDRTGKPMTAAERAKLEAELAAARTQAAEEKRQEIQRPD